MYRMVLVDENQRSLQKLFWRSSPEQRLQEYTSNTITSRTKSVPFLAICCLRQLGLDYLKSNPKTAQAILHDFYVVTFSLIRKVWLWSDLQVALSWIYTSPDLLQTFVQIQDLIYVLDWHYIKSEDNPKDTLSRGLFPEKLIQHTMWWSGPSWLSLDYDFWPRINFKRIDNLSELKKQKQTLVAVELHSFPFERFSKLCRLPRTVAYCFRFAHDSKGSTCVGLNTASFGFSPAGFGLSAADVGLSSAGVLFSAAGFALSAAGVGLSAAGRVFQNENSIHQAPIRSGKERPTTGHNPKTIRSRIRIPGEPPLLRSQKASMSGQSPSLRGSPMLGSRAGPHVRSETRRDASF
ncbi:hypothetical protein ILUMI_19348 [Ignelater luminosus]|uniref:Uncharacterized protein n=1 Tax=Ignelater luminosus TaxID=2038154 RepID=A0A8K0CN94_IGNLU|nr:hypothetical protein ILUMI_19348 [Ignelater luminosus]